jgi:hypothetical protein
MISVPQNSTLLGLDVHKLTISAAVLPPGHDVAVVDKISSDPEAVRRLIGRFEDPKSLVACYEASSARCGSLTWPKRRCATGAGPGPTW